MLEERGESVARLDLRAPSDAERGDVRDAAAVRKALGGCRGIVHFAAVSRVVWGEEDPERCRSTNIGGTSAVIDAAFASRPRPWLITASSREVYGQPDALPVTEDAPLVPINLYGRTKLAAERMVEEAKSAGLLATTVRLSNVYGSPLDYADRVLPAFARGALFSEPLRVDGSDHTFDFTHVDDVVRGLILAIAQLDAGEPPPTLHLLTGTPTTLSQAARLAIELAGSRSELLESAARTYDVARFWGDPSRARRVLGWKAEIDLRRGLARLIEDLRTTLDRPTVDRAR